MNYEEMQACVMICATLGIMCYGMYLFATSQE